MKKTDPLAAMGARIDAEIEAMFTPEAWASFERGQRFGMLKRYLAALFSPYTEADTCLYAEFRAIAGDGRVERRWSDLPGLLSPDGADAKQLYRWMHEMDSLGWAVYVGVLPRREAGNGKKANVPLASWLWVDMDYKQAGEEATLTRLSRLNPYPDMIVLSGNGAHLYYKLERLEDLEGAAARRFEKSLSSLQQRVQPQSDGTHDVTRVLRLPGSHNRKSPVHPCLVTLAHCPKELAI